MTMPQVRANGVELFYDLAGPEGAPVVAFSNSIGSTIEMWDPQARALAGRYRCLRYDARGHGRSEVVDRPARLDDLADDLAGLLDALGIAKAHVVGLSLGGMTAQNFAVRHPDRLDGLVLMATSAHLPTGWDERIALVREKGMAALADTVMERWFTPAFREASPDKVAPFRERFLAVDPRGYAACCAAIRDMDLRASNASIKAPTLIVAGADDPATPAAMMEEIRSRIPDAELVVLPRAAHILTVEQPERVNGYLLAFLDRFPREARAPGGASFEAGLSNRKSVLGAEHVERSLARAGAFSMPWQDFITRAAWGEVWGDPTLPWKTRSLVTLAMMVALHREEEFKLHVRPALRNGVTVEELRSLLLQSAIYAGVPAANAAFRWAKEVLGDEIEARS
jgi:3-oxoadipate enol-lactonase/4-carboxymuconolactone decarboxylase